MKEKSLSRRRFFGAAGGLAGAAAANAAAAATRKPTPPQTEGPFYPITSQADKDADLTLIEGRTERALGEIVHVKGRVVDADGAPIADAVVDVWQANAAGRYAHEADPNPAPLDPNFQGWAIVKTNANGEYAFTTVRPGAYPVAANWTRPPHIHFKVSRRGFKEITTQMYFPDEEALNDVDQLLNAVPADRRGALVSKRLDNEDGDAPIFAFDVALAAV